MIKSKIRLLQTGRDVRFISTTTTSVQRGTKSFVLNFTIFITSGNSRNIFFMIIKCMYMYFITLMTYDHVM